MKTILSAALLLALFVPVHAEEKGGHGPANPEIQAENQEFRKEMRAEHKEFKEKQREKRKAHKKKVRAMRHKAKKERREMKKAAADAAAPAAEEAPAAR